jgi:hypothetical protein
MENLLKVRDGFSYTRSGFSKLTKCQIQTKYDAVILTKYDAEVFYCQAIGYVSLNSKQSWKGHGEEDCNLCSIYAWWYR